MIIDNFMYNNDSELLELRYHMLKDVVDVFVISEANHTFTGTSKPFYARNVVNELGLDVSKFIFLETDTSDSAITILPIDIHEAKDVKSSDTKTYARLRTQKDAILKILDRFPEDSVFFISDIDEIPRPKAVKYIASVCRNHPNNIIKIPLVLLESSADKRVYDSNNDYVQWNRAFTVCTKKQISDKGPSALRTEYENPYKPIVITENGKTVQDLGWHFTWMGDKNKKLEKAKSSAHFTALNFVNNVTEETKELLKADLGDDFAIIINYHHKPYPHSELPPEIFALPRVRKFLLPHTETKKIIDYFMYFNEKELLELRYHMYKDYVDMFIISESNVTFSGQSKSFTCEDAINELGLDPTKFRILKSDLSQVTRDDVKEIDKLGSMVANDVKNVLSWVRERLQRDAMISVIEEFEDDCVFIVSDIDEFIKPDSIPYLSQVCKNHQHVVLKVPLVLLESRADKRMTNINGTPVLWDKSLLLATKSQLKLSSPNVIRAGLQKSFPISYITENGQRVEDLGWHFTWMGDVQRQKIKALNYGHAGNLNVVNTLSEETSKELSKVLDKTIELHQKYKLVDYDVAQLPKEIFTLPRVKNYLLPDVTEIIERTDIVSPQLLLDFINDPQNYLTNFKLGYNYETIGQTAAAASFYLRTAEKTDRKDVQYECFLRLANCFKKQKNRNFTITGIYNRAITIDPTRPEAYYLMSNFQLENKDHQAAYLYSTIGLSLLSTEHEKLLTDTEYFDVYQLQYIQAKSGWFVGFYQKSKETLLSLRNREDVSDLYKESIDNDFRSIIK